MGHPAPAAAATRLALPISLRLGEDLTERLERFTEKNGVSRSEAIRLLLEVAFGDSAKLSAAREAVQLRRRYVTKLRAAVEAVEVDDE